MNERKTLQIKGPISFWHFQIKWMGSIHSLLIRHTRALKKLDINLINFQRINSTTLIRRPAKRSQKTSSWRARPSAITARNRRRHTGRHSHHRLSIWRASTGRRRRRRKPVHLRQPAERAGQTVPTARRANGACCPSWLLESAANPAT